jgi:hypothetical protein
LQARGRCAHYGDIFTAADTWSQSYEPSNYADPMSAGLLAASMTLWAAHKPLDRCGGDFKP